MIPMVDLKRQYHSLKNEIDQAISNVLEQTQFIFEPNVKAPEEEIAAYHELPYAVGVANGTDVLLLALRTCGIKAGDEVITTPATALQEKDIASAVYYPVPLHQQEFFLNLYNLSVKLPQNEVCASEVLSLPMFSELNQEKISFIAGVINNAQ